MVALGLFAHVLLYEWVFAVQTQIYPLIAVWY